MTVEFSSHVSFGGAGAGTPGADGADGADGEIREFESVIARDTYYAANPTFLKVGLPITVHTVDNLVLSLLWMGEDQPSSYSGTAGWG